MQQPTTSNRLRPFRPTPFGRYTLLMPLSMGGMGEIFLARIDGPQGFEKLCVIKKILPHLAEDKDFVSRFVNEARTLVKLTHGSIAQVLDMGQYQGDHYLALEYVDGKDLRKVSARFRERGMPVPPTFVLFVMGRVLDALAYAHRKRDDDDKEIGLVHRDMSPQNILISYEGEVKVIDFGLAKSTLNNAKTNPSIILGKFLYMSPEQAKHGKVDRRSDLYAVGICLYELIAGKNPFEDVAPHALMAAVANPNIAHVQQVEPLCPTSIAQVIMRALAVDPDKRFQTAEELRGKLTQALLEIDATAGPESCSRFMRDMFAAEYQAERKLLAQLKEAASKSELKSEVAIEPSPLPRTSTVRPLTVARPPPKLEPAPGPGADEATPAPTDLRRYGLEPTMPRAIGLEQLSFSPTAKSGGTEKGHEGDRETVPGVILDRQTGTVTRTAPTGLEDDRITVPHMAVYHPSGAPSSDLSDDAPTRPLGLPLSRAVTPAAPQAVPEPITSEVAVVGDGSPSDQDLPSVMVNGLPAKSQGPRILATPMSVRAAAVVAPLPKALEGRARPDDGNTATDRGTRSRRASLWVVLVPLISFLALAGFVGLNVLQQQQREEADDLEQNKSLLKPDTDDRSRKSVKSSPLGDDEVAAGDPVVSGPPASPVEDELPSTLTKEPTPAPAPPARAKRLPKTRAGNELAKTRTAFARLERSHIADEKTINSLRLRLDAFEDRIEKPVASEAWFVQGIIDLRADIEKQK